MNVYLPFRFALICILLTAPAGAQQDVPYVQTDWAVVDSMLALANPQKGEKLYDLGCGDGRIVVRAARVYGVRGVGIDSNPIRIRESWENAKKEGVAGHVEFYVKDLFAYDFSDADIVTMYLLQWVNLKLRPTLFRDLKPGTRIVSHAWSMGEWMPDRQIQVERADERGKSYVHFWVIPANVSGEWTWSLQDGSVKRNYTLKVTQEFQNVYGALTADGTTKKIEDMQISGGEFRFSMQDGGVTTEYRGTADENTIRGSVSVSGNTLKWQARRNPKTMFPLDREGPLKVTY